MVSEPVLELALVDQAGLDITEVFASQVLALKACITTALLVIPYSVPWERLKSPDRLCL